MNVLEQTFGNIINKTMKGIHDSDQHLMTLFAICLQTKAKNILELGVRDGDTSEPMLLAAHMNGGKLTSVDIEPTRWGPPQELGGNWQFVQQDALTFLDECIAQGKRFDVILVDDLHKYEHVKKELERIDKISDVNTVILLHDLMGEGNYPNYFLPIAEHYNGQVWEGGGPYRAVKELDPVIWEWSTIPVNHGLTILRKRSKVVTPFL